MVVVSAGCAITVDHAFNAVKGWARSELKGEAPLLEKNSSGFLYRAFPLRRAYWPFHKGQAKNNEALKSVSDTSTYVVRGKGSSGKRLRPFCNTNYTLKIIVHKNSKRNTYHPHLENSPNVLVKTM